MNQSLKVLALSCHLLLWGAAMAQNTAPGQYISSDKKDTSVSSHYHDDPQDHLHQTTIPVQGDNNGSGNGMGGNNNGSNGGNSGSNNGSGQDVRTGYEGSTGDANLGDNSAAEVATNGKKAQSGMLNAAVGLFGIGALVGLYLLSFLLGNNHPPKLVAGLHGVLVLTGIGLLIAYSMKNQPAPITSLVLYCIAVLGGLTVLYMDLNKKQVPKWLPVVHGLIALSGFITLLVFAYA